MDCYSHTTSRVCCRTSAFVLLCFTPRLSHFPSSKQRSSQPSLCETQCLSKISRIKHWLFFRAEACSEISQRCRLVVYASWKKENEDFWSFMRYPLNHNTSAVRFVLSVKDIDLVGRSENRPSAAGVRPGCTLKWLEMCDTITLKSW